MKKINSNMRAGQTHVKTLSDKITESVKFMGALKPFGGTGSFLETRSCACLNCPVFYSPVFLLGVRYLMQAGA